MFPIQEIRLLVGDAKIQDALKETLLLNTEFNDIIIGLQARLTTLEKKELQNVISPADANLELNSIINSLLAVLSKIENQARLAPNITSIGAAKDNDENGIANRLYFARLVAITQVFSRNFTHHLGSHIHPRTKSEGLEARLRELLGNRPVKPQATRQFINWLHDYYSDYITARNEFMADPFQASKNVHFYQELVLPFVENMLVMDNIAANEGICYKNNEENRLKIQVRYRGEFLKARYEFSDNPSIRGTFAKDNPKIRYPDFFPYFIDLSRTSPELSYPEFYANKKLEVIRDPVVSVPHEHAFFSLLENYIRNVAKHQKKAFSTLGSASCLEIKLEMTDLDESGEHYTVDLYDNVSHLENAAAWNRFRDRINTKLVKPDTLLPANENLGLLDMKICAAMLAGRRNLVSTWEDQTESPLQVGLRTVDGSLITQEVSENDHEKIDWPSSRINYRFKIQKARRICYIGNQVSSSLEDRQNWAKQGLFVFEDAESFLEQNKRSTATYGFAIIEEAAIARVSDQELDQILFNLPFKTLINSSAGFPCPQLRWAYFAKRVQRTTRLLRPGPEPVKTFQQKCWREWIGRFGSLQNTLLIVHREQSSPEWKQAAQQFNQAGSPFQLVLDQPDQSALAGLTMRRDHSYVMFDHHGNSVEPFFDKESDKGLLLLRQANNAHLAYDIASKDYSKIAFPRFPKPEEPWLFPYELLQTGLLRILIIDERLAEYAHKPAEGKIRQQFPYVGKDGHVSLNMRNFDLCWASNVFIATHVNFYNSGTQPLSGKIKYGESDHTLTISFDETGLRSHTTFSEDQGKKREIPYDFVILHRAVLSQSQLLNGTDPKYFVRKLREHIPHVVLESAGNNYGFEETLAKFISFSELSTFFNDKSVSKLSLIQRLTSLIA